ncbi:MAG: pilus assembly protein PilP [Pseudomonadota bacterium]
MRTVSALALLSLPLALVQACGDDEMDDSAPVAELKVATQSESAVTPENAKEDESLVYTYNAVGKRDPFRTYFSEIEREDAVSRKLTELQQYDLDQLRLVAVIVGTATPKAMVEDPTGKGHVVKTGTLVGKHWGQVKHIRRGEIIIQEEFRDFTGRRVTHLVPMKLPEEEKVKLE